MKKLKNISLFVIIPLIIFACSQPFENSKTNDLIYAYNGYDSTGVKIVTGWLELNVEDSSAVCGSWQFYGFADAEQIGPQQGKGKLAGTIEDSKIYLDLNPDFRDNNVLLVSRFNKSKLSGEWMWVGFPGVINSGTFAAVH